MTDKNKVVPFSRRRDNRDAGKKPVTRPKSSGERVPDDGPKLKTDRLMTIEEFAEFIGLARSTVYDHINRGVLKPGLHYYQVGVTKRFPFGEGLEKALADITKNSIRLKEQERKSKDGKEQGKSRAATANLNYKSKVKKDG